MIRTKDMTENVKEQNFLWRKDLNSSSATKMLDLELKKANFSVSAGGASAAPWPWAISLNQKFFSFTHVSVSSLQLLGK